VVLVDGQPILPPEQIPALVGPDGWFQPDMVKTAFAIAFNPAARAQMRAEVRRNSPPLPPRACGWTM
jgi:hypothetical protein